MSSALAERVTGGRYIDVRIRPAVAARYGLSQADVHRLVSTIVGGEPIGETIEGRERYPIVVRYPRTQRDSLVALAQLPIVATGGVQVTLGEVADLALVSGPPMLKSENGRPVGYVFVDVAGRDLGSVVADLQRRTAESWAAARLQPCLVRPVRIPGACAGTFAPGWCRPRSPPSSC